MRLPSVLRRLVAAVPAILMVLATLGLAPTASAASSGDYSLSYEFEPAPSSFLIMVMSTVLFS